MKWTVIEEEEDDFFTSYYQNQNEGYEGRYGDNNVDGGGYDGDYGAADNYGGEYGGNYGDAAAEEEEEQQEEQQEEQEEDEEVEVVVVEDNDSGFDPYLAFDIGKCDTYSHLWTYDLFVTCQSGEEFCECTYAEELLNRGYLTCTDIDSCPDECGVCSNCLHSVCDKYKPTSIVASGLQTNAGYAVAVVFSATLLAAFVAWKKKDNFQKVGKLGESLMEDGTSYTSKNWVVPLNKYGLPTTRKSKVEKQVWLVPDVSTIPKKPLFPDVLKGSLTRNDPPGANPTRDPPGVNSPSKQRSSKKSSKGDPLHPGPVVVTSEESVPSSLSCDSNKDDDEDDSYGFSQPEDEAQYRSANKSIGSNEGEI